METEKDEATQGRLEKRQWTGSRTSAINYERALNKLPALKPRRTGRSSPSRRAGSALGVH